MAPEPRLLFLNLPVADVAASRRFFAELGFAFNEMFSDAATACLVVSDQASVMLLERERFAGFVALPVADASTATAATVCVSAPERAGVDSLADAALAAGGTPAKEPLDMGFMYGRSFYDLDGHHWEVVWMDPQAAEQGPPDMVESAA